jgi:hypothetical protein
MPKENEPPGERWRPPKPGRDERGRWLRGVSGNPGGAARRAIDLRRLARRYGENALELLHKFMLDPTVPVVDRARIAEQIARIAGGSITVSRLRAERSRREAETDRLMQTVLTSLEAEAKKVAGPARNESTEAQVQPNKPDWLS